MPRIFSRWCHPGRRYTRRSRRAPAYSQAPHSGGYPLTMFSRGMWAGRAEIHLEVDDIPEEDTLIEDKEDSATATFTTMTAPTSSATTVATSATTSAASTTTTSSTSSATASTSNRAGQKKNFMHHIKLVLQMVVSYLERVFRKKETGGGGIPRGNGSKRGAHRCTTKKKFLRRYSLGRRYRAGLRQPVRRQASSSWRNDRARGNSSRENPSGWLVFVGMKVRLRESAAAGMSMTRRRRIS